MSSDDAPLTLPPALVKFVGKLQVPLDWYLRQLDCEADLPRFVRINSNNSTVEQNNDIQQQALLVEQHQRSIVDELNQLASVAAESCASTDSKTEETHTTSDKLSRFISLETAVKVGWFSNCQNFPSVFALPSQVKLSCTPVYERGDVYGLDVASCFTVHALDVQVGQRVLDLCCAPGAKLCLIADVMRRQGTLVGVDISRQRCLTCASLLRKYGSINALGTVKNMDANSGNGWAMALACADGTTVGHDEEGANAKEHEGGELDIVWDTLSQTQLAQGAQIVVEPTDHATTDDNVASTNSTSAAPTGGRDGSTRKRVNKSMRARIKRQRAEAGSVGHDGRHLVARGSFDRVLVDAECSHDGSIRHMRKYLGHGEWGPEALADKFLKANGDLDALESLQRKLLANGFSMLRPGGVLVYSTCSFSSTQNECVVRWLLDTCSDAELVEVDGVGRVRCISEEQQEGRIVVNSSSDVGGNVVAGGFERLKPRVASGRVVEGKGSATRGIGIYFTPTLSFTSGLFICKIRKKET